ncbi:MAG TPA: hypothetical protein VFF28_06400 [Candidatus Nanoarchaeia archaeon]|nr:hypothetical protein [Candidatus Nanoarchaeia archaeon]
MLEKKTDPEQVKSRKWIFKLVLVLIIIAIIYYLYTHPDIIRSPVNKFFEGLNA